MSEWNGFGGFLSTKGKYWFIENDFKTRHVPTTRCVHAIIENDYVIYPHVIGYGNDENDVICLDCILDVLSNSWKNTYCWGCGKLTTNSGGDECENFNDCEWELESKIQRHSGEGQIIGCKIPIDFLINK